MARTARSSRPGLAAAEAHLRDHALAMPEATEHFPWGERAIKVKGKVFLFMRADATELSLSTKLPRSGPVALMLPFAQPTGYGLGKAGWVSARFAAADPPPLDMLCAWIDESYLAVAPARLAQLVVTAATLPAPARKPAPEPRPAPTTTPKPRPARKPAPATTPKPRTARKPAPATTPKPRPARKPAPITVAPKAKRQRAAQRRGLGLDRR